MYTPHYATHHTYMYIPQTYIHAHPTIPLPPYTLFEGQEPFPQYSGEGEGI